MVVTRAKNWRWEEVEKDSIELSLLAKHYELYNRTEVDIYVLISVSYPSII